MYNFNEYLHNDLSQGWIVLCEKVYLPYHLIVSLRFSVLSGLDSDLVDGGEEDDEYDVAIKERRRNKAAQQGAVKDKPRPQSPDMR